VLVVLQIAGRDCYLPVISVNWSGKSRLYPYNSDLHYNYFLVAVFKYMA